MKKKTILLAATAVMLVAAMSIGGMLAYFTDTDEAENVFTVGKVDIELTEPKWDADEAALIPTRVIPKDPTITVTTDSQTAYTFMKVELSEDFATLLTNYAVAKGWTDSDDAGTLIDAWFTSTVKPKVMAMDLTNRYVILGVLSPKKAGESVKYFDEVKVPADVVESMYPANGEYSINITAYAIQAEGFYDEAEAAELTGDDLTAYKMSCRTAAFTALFPNETMLP